MPDPDPKVTVPSVPTDEELRDLADELACSDDDVIFDEICRLRDRTREATQSRITELEKRLVNARNKLLEQTTNFTQSGCAALAKDPSDVSR